VSDAGKIKADGGFKGIEIDTPFEWVIEGVNQPGPFFEHLAVLLPQDAILYLEGTKIGPEVAAFYSAHAAPNPAQVRRDTIYPEPRIYHISFSAEVSAALRQFAATHAVPEMFDHLKAYRGDTFLFSFHDAFQGVLRISENVPADSIAKFCEALGVSSSHQQVQRFDPAHARKILLALEKFERSHAPWFKRAWYWITGA